MTLVGASTMYWLIIQRKNDIMTVVLLVVTSTVLEYHGIRYSSTTVCDVHRRCMHVDAETGNLRSKPFLSRWIFPGIALQLLVNPQMETVSHYQVRLEIRDICSPSRRTRSSVPLDGCLFLSIVLITSAPFHF